MYMKCPEQSNPQKQKADQLPDNGKFEDILVMKCSEISGDRSTVYILKLLEIYTLNG